MHQDDNPLIAVEKKENHITITRSLHTMTLLGIRSLDHDGGGGSGSPRATDEAANTNIDAEVAPVAVSA